MLEKGRRGERDEAVRGRGGTFGKGRRGESDAERETGEEGEGDEGG